MRRILEGTLNTVHIELCGGGTLNPPQHDRRQRCDQRLYDLTHAHVWTSACSCRSHQRARDRHTFLRGLAAPKRSTESAQIAMSAICRWTVGRPSPLDKLSTHAVSRAGRRRNQCVRESWAPRRLWRAKRERRLGPPHAPGDRTHAKGHDQRNDCRLNSGRIDSIAVPSNVVPWSRRLPGTCRRPAHSGHIRVGVSRPSESRQVGAAQTIYTGQQHHRRRLSKLRSPTAAPWGLYAGCAGERSQENRDAPVPTAARAATRGRLRMRDRALSPQVPR